VIEEEREREREMEICREFIVARRLIYQGGFDLSVRPRCGPAGDRRDSETDWPISLARHFERTGLPAQRCVPVAVYDRPVDSICGLRFSVFSRPSDIARLYRKRMIRAIDLRRSTSESVAMLARAARLAIDRFRRSRDRNIETSDISFFSSISRDS